MSLDIVEYDRKPKTILVLEVTEENIEQFASAQNGVLHVRYRDGQKNSSVEIEDPLNMHYVQAGNFVEYGANGKIESVWSNVEKFHEVYVKKSEAADV